MHTSTLINLLVALSAGALASTTQTSPAPLSKRDLGSIATYAAADCSGSPIISVSQDPKASPDNPSCLKFKGNKGDHVGVHWGDVPGIKGLLLYYDDACTVGSNNQVFHRSKGSQDDCYILADRGILAVEFVTWELHAKDPPQDYWVGA